MDTMNTSFDPNNTFTNDWLQQNYADLPLFDPSSDYTNNFNKYSILDPWNDKSFNHLETESYQSPISDMDDYFTLNHNHVITPTIEDTPALSPTPSHRAFSEAESTPPPVEAPKRKRGRPSRKESTASTATCTSPISKSHRTPHNQVERKYREGLNAEMERLRLAIPATARWENGSSSSPSALAGSLKPSKAMVLACAIDYIREVERERDELAEENMTLKR